MDAKKALTETDGDMEAAVDWLRTKGLAKAAKKSGRTAAEGLVGRRRQGRARGRRRGELGNRFRRQERRVPGDGRRRSPIAALGATRSDALKAAEDGWQDRRDHVTDAIAKIGENMALRRMAAVEGDTVVAYVHNAAADGMGKIGVLVALNGEDNGIGKQIAMHVAAAEPGLAVAKKTLIRRSSSVKSPVLTEQARESGKPEAVIEKMIEGRMKKFMAEVTLLGQQFVINPDVTVARGRERAGVEMTGVRPDGSRRGDREEGRGLRGRGRQDCPRLTRSCPSMPEIENGADLAICTVPFSPRPICLGMRTRRGLGVPI